MSVQHLLPPPALPFDGKRKRPQHHEAWKEYLKALPTEAVRVEGVALNYVAVAVASTPAPASAELPPPPLPRKKSSVSSVPDKVALPPLLTACPTSNLIELIARLLDLLIKINDQQPQPLPVIVPALYSTSAVDALGPQITRFHLRLPPNISVQSYLSRLAHYSLIPNAVLVAAVYYIDLLSARFPAFTLNLLTVHRFLLTATTVGCKGLLDAFATNTHYARVGGVQVHELNLLETEFLGRVGWCVVPRDGLGLQTAGTMLHTYYRRLIELVGDLGEGLEEGTAMYVLGRTVPPQRQQAERDDAEADDDDDSSDEDWY